MPEQSTIESRFRPEIWALLLGSVCLLPFLAMLMGVDFSTRIVPLDPAAAATMTKLELSEAAHAALRGSYTHTLLEWSALAAAVFCGLLAFVQYRLTKDASLPIIGVALICAGAMDGFHTFAADRLIVAVADNKNLIPFTWAICRLFHILILLVGIGIALVYRNRGNKENGTGMGLILSVSAGFFIVSYAIVRYCAHSANLPQTMFPDSAIKRPFDIYPLVPYVIAGLFVFPRYIRRNKSVFGQMLMLSLIPGVATELYMAFGSFSLHDSAFNVAHALKVLEYAVPLSGLVLAYVETYQGQARLASALNKQSRELQGRTNDLVTAQSSLKQAARFAESLNKSKPQEIFAGALREILSQTRVPFAAIYMTSVEQKLHCREALGVDGMPARSGELSAEGLPNRVLETASPQVLHGPFASDQLRIRIGIGDVALQSLHGWPISYRGETIGVLLTAHVTPLAENQGAGLLAALEQLAIRMSAIRIEEERVKLVRDLQTKSVALEEVSRKAQKASKVKGEFLANMSHELRTPMNSIMGFTHRLLKRLQGAISERDFDALVTVDRNAKRLLTLINSILDLSKIEAGKMELSCSIVDLNDIAREVIQELEPLTDGKPIELVWTESELPKLEADAAKCKQIITNLVSNGIKYTPSGTVELSLCEEECPGLGRVVCICVRDTGVGIDWEDQKQLFRQFTQIDGTATRKVGGTGLGLFIADQFARMHGGRIELESEKGKGSSFSVLLPLEASAHPSKPSHPSSEREEYSPPIESTPSALPSPAGAKQEKVQTRTLLVDDTPEIIGFVHQTFESMGYASALVTDCASALAEARARRLDILCLDNQSSQEEVLQALSNDPGLPSIPVVISHGTHSGAADEGSVRHIPKPVDPDSLVKTVREILATSFQRALLVEDDPDTAGLVKTAIEEHGKEVFVVENGMKGLEALRKRNLDAVILDLALPGMDGFEFLRRMRSQAETKDLPVVVLTSKDLTRKDIADLKFMNAAVLVKGEADMVALNDAVLQKILSVRGTPKEQSLG